MIIFDTDMSLGTPGAEIDDGAALIFLLRAMGERVTAVTITHGNTNLENVLHNSRHLLTYLGREDLPLGRGAAQGIIEEKAWFADWQAGYGRTPPWPDQSPLPLAANLIIETVRANPGQVTLIAVGPLTNLALAVRLAPDIVPLVRQVVTMGGSLADKPTPEFNARCDPEAAHIVLNAGWPLRLIGLEITSQVPFSRAAFARLPDDDPALKLLKTQADGWIDRVESMGWGNNDCSLHDALAVAAVLDESLFEWQETAVSVTLHPQNQRGITRAVPQKGNLVETAVSVDADRCRDLIWSYLVTE
ncbi:nucleoside hydrolase [Candidatus Leptofilum sp.]|uniref:nucleoside hydrolase n=1 Tax=Candidatus Leptofilum sp. TaxID=3241576 RepID=UPI003B592BFD